MYKYLPWFAKGSKRKRALAVGLIFSLSIFCANAIYYAIRPAYGRYVFAKQFEPIKQPVQAKILVAYVYGVGENETAERIKIAGQNLKPMIDVRILCMLKNDPNKGVSINNGLKYNDKSDAIDIAVKKFKPDILLALQPIKYNPGVANYVTMTNGLANYVYLDDQQKPQLTHPNLLSYQGVLTAFKDVNVLNAIYTQNNKKFVHMPWYVTAQINDYAPAEPKYLFYSGADLWDSTRRGSDKFIQMFSMLEKTGYFAVCGSPEKWQHTPNSYIGFLPIDGKSIIAKIHESGISLLLHSIDHINSGVPTARIFEAASANALIISDRHPFVVEHFGDNVLYIDNAQDAEGMFKQIDHHVRWALQNPQQAQRMAENCNKIHKQKFSLEQQLLNLLEVHKANQTQA